MDVWIVIRYNDIIVEFVKEYFYPTYASILTIHNNSYKYVIIYGKDEFVKTKRETGNWNAWIVI